MTFEIMGMGAGVAKAPDGNGFEGKGDWFLFKCFYRQGDEEYGEFYLNIDLKAMVAELKCKDGGYAKVLTEAFARAMRGK